MAFGDGDIDGYLGISRRQLIARGAIVGGTVWAVPLIQSMSAPAFAQGVTYGGGRTDISYVAIIYDCGDGARGLKIDSPDGCQDADATSGCNLLEGCGGVGETPGCLGDFFGSTPSGSCADIASAVVDTNGNVTITLRAGCTISSVRAKCGSAGCADAPSEYIVISGGNSMTVISDNFCPNPVGA